MFLPDLHIQHDQVVSSCWLKSELQLSYSWRWSLRNFLYGSFPNLSSEIINKGTDAYTARVFANRSRGVIIYIRVTKGPGALGTTASRLTMTFALGARNAIREWISRFFFLSPRKLSRLGLVRCTSHPTIRECLRIRVTFRWYVVRLQPCRVSSIVPLQITLLVGGVITLLTLKSVFTTLSTTLYHVFYPGIFIHDALATHGTCSDDLLLY